MNRKTKIVVSVAGILIVTLALIGLTFGYYLTRINGNTNPKSISASTQKLELTYSDNSNEIIGDGKELVPSNEPIGSKTFTVTNNGGDTNYSVVLEDMSIKDATTNEETTFESNDFRYTLTCTTKSGSSCNNEISVQEVLQLSDGILINNDIAKEDVHTYTLTIWYINTDQDQSEDMGKSLNARINISTAEKFNPYKNNKNTLAYHIINNAILQKNGTSLVSKTKTKPAQEITMTYVDGKPGSETTENFTTTRNATSSYYFTYGDTFTYTTSHTISNKDGSALKAVQLSSGYTTLKGKYIVSYSGSSSSTPVSGTNKYTIYYVMDATSSSITYTTVSAGLKQMERYITYGDSYKFNKITGNYDIVNKDGSALKAVKYSENLDKLKGKYIVSTSVSTNSTPASGTNKYTIYQVTNNSTTTQLKYTSITKSNTSYINLESTLSMAADDYGTSYYYRGGVIDNYLELNNMCFRIVRIQGDGSIKIILAKEDTCSSITSSDTNTAFINNASTYVYGYIKDSTNNYRFNYEGYEGGLYTTLNNWYNTKMISVQDKLKNETWCLGGKASRYDYDTGALLDATSTKTSWYYETGKRLWGIGQTPEATYKCSSEADKVTGYVGALIADEVVYAGGKAGTANYTYYLRDNAQSYYWLLSRARIDGANDYAFFVNVGGDLYNLYVNNSVVVRPAVTIATGAEIASGDGTQNNPYTIK